VRRVDSLRSLLMLAWEEICLTTSIATGNIIMVVAVLEIHINKNAVATIDRSAKVHTERPELSGYYLPRILIASGGKKCGRGDFSQS